MEYNAGNKEKYNSAFFTRNIKIRNMKVIITRQNPERSLTGLLVFSLQFFTVSGTENLENQSA